MSATGQLLISKIINAGNATDLITYNIKPTDFATEAERKCVQAIQRYADSNEGCTPSYAILAAEHPDIVYVPDVSDSVEYLAGKLKDEWGKRRIAETINGLDAQFQEKNSASFIESLTETLDGIKMEVTGTSVRKNTNALVTIPNRFREEYEKRKAGTSFKLWRTPFPSLNEEIGGLYSGDIYGIMAESGRGKTYLSEVIVDELLRQGAKVLVKSYEVKWYPWISRLISIITAREEAISSDEFEVKVGLPNKAILSGRLADELETYLFDIVDKLNEYYPGTLILQAKGDADLTRTLDDLDRELHAIGNVDAVLVDPFYGLSDVYGRNSNKTTGGAAEQAARRFEAIIGKHDVVGMFTIQAHTERQEVEDGQQREIKLPKRDQVKTTKAVLEIATNLFVFDAVNGNGKIGVEKGRNGGEGFTVDLIALLDYGVLRELCMREEAQQFADVSGF
ncbi:DNA helicase [Paenibacillus sp. PDC88]|uniref:DNA helicase n=1 Tax=Paenibacillus sp. PDC88 TaxID=1884375 RepID=UPI0008945D5F|nr:DNA helicase [Paenibacillus sp. PDC88]SDW24298.1 replicative DNA helicase [Paenibacillus sp. PDC88]